MEVDVVDIDGKKALGVRIPLDGAPLILIKGNKGFIMCGLLNVEAADSLNMVCARVSGVTSFEEILEKPVVEVSQAARALGIEPGMSGREALMRML